MTPGAIVLCGPFLWTVDAVTPEGLLVLVDGPCRIERPPGCCTPYDARMRAINA